MKVFKDNDGVIIVDYRFPMAIRSVDDKIDSTGYECVCLGWHTIVIKDCQGKTLYKEHRDHKKYSLFANDQEAVVFWYPETEIRGNSLCGAIMDSIETHKRIGK